MFKANTFDRKYTNLIIFFQLNFLQINFFFLNMSELTIPCGRFTYEKETKKATRLNEPG